MGKSKQFTLQLGLAPLVIATVNHTYNRIPLIPHNSTASMTDVLCLLTCCQELMRSRKPVCVARTIWLADKASASVSVWRRAESRGYVAHTLQIPLQCLQNNCIIQNPAHVGLSINPRMLLLLLFLRDLKRSFAVLWSKNKPHCSYCE